MGTYHFEGNGVEQSYDKAAEYYLQAADINLSAQLYNTAWVHYRAAICIKKLNNIERAIEELVKARSIAERSDDKSAISLIEEIAVLRQELDDQNESQLAGSCYQNKSSFTVNLLDWGHVAQGDGTEIRRTCDKEKQDGG